MPSLSCLQGDKIIDMYNYCPDYESQTWEGAKVHIGIINTHNTRQRVVCRHKTIHGIPHIYFKSRIVLEK